MADDEKLEEQETIQGLTAKVRQLNSATCVFLSSLFFLFFNCLFRYAVLTSFCVSLPTLFPCSRSTPTLHFFL